MAKYNEKTVEKVVSLIEEGIYSITDICEILHMSRKTFYSWRDSKPEFRKAIEDAMELCEEKLLAKARQSLQKKLEGYTLTETKLKYIPDDENPTELKLKEKVVKIKEYAPDNRTIKMVLDRNTLNKNGDESTDKMGAPLQIFVRDENTKNQLEILQKRLQRKTG